ncbi:MAG: hypothetical protein Q4A28_07845 [Brachymonas sp.]|nr:hypothetical protein [Brachymonas sp.]
MKKCQQYVFKLTSGQLDDAPLGERLQAQLHLLVCSRCRAFTRNNAALDGIFQHWREQLQTPDMRQPATPHAPGDSTSGTPPPTAPDNPA